MSNLLPDGPSGYHLLAERARQEGYAQAIEDVVAEMRRDAERMKHPVPRADRLAMAFRYERRFSGKEGS